MASKPRRRLYEGFGVLEQESKKIESKPESKSVEIDSKVSFNTLQTEFQHTSNGEQTQMSGVEKEFEESSKNTSNGVEKHYLDSIVGRERDFLFYIAYQCQKNGSLNTEPLTSEVLRKDLNHSTDGLKTVIYRLSQKQLIHKKSVKAGRSGWVVFQLSKDLYDQIISHKHFFNTLSTHFKLGSKESLNGGYNSNELKNLNTITAEEKSHFLIAENLSKIGIGQKQLGSILNLGVLSFDDVQSSLDQYSYDLSKGKKPNLALFFGILRKGSGYISQQYSEILESEIKKEIDRIQRTQELEKEKLKSEMYEKFQSFKNENPQFLDEVRKAQSFQVSDQVLENLAFARFCENET